MLSSPAVRLSLLYAALFTVVGLQMPYWPVWLEGRGMGPVEIGTLLAASFWAKVVTNPLIGHFVDATGRRKPVMVALALASLAVATLYLVFDSFLALFLLGLIGWSMFAGMMPLSETLTMNLTRHGQVDYGRVRLWGSLSFIAASLLGGVLLGWVPGTEVILWAILGASVLIVVAVWGVPDPKVERRSTRRLPFTALFRYRSYLVFLLAASLVQVGHTIYYGFATLHWQAAGLSGVVIGGLWGLGVVAEVVLFARSGRVVGWLGPRRLILLGALAGVVRWSVLAETTNPWLLAPAQILHGLTFGATHLGAMHFIAGAIPAGLTTRAQALYSSTAMGLTVGLAMLAAGPLYAAFGGEAFWVSSGVAVLASLTAWALLRMKG